MKPANLQVNLQDFQIQNFKYIFEEFVRRKLH